MRKIIATTVLLSLFGLSAALAQSTGNPGSSSNPPASASKNAPAVGNAPVGHRQPRADEVPSAQEKNYIESAEDKALDRKIKSICRGC